jgi:hypothetical protein
MPKSKSTRAALRRLALSLAVDSFIFARENLLSFIAKHPV